MRDGEKNRSGKRSLYGMARNEEVLKEVYATGRETRKWQMNNVRNDKYLLHNNMQNALRIEKKSLILGVKTS
jgi:hypothetical protein